MSDLVIIKIFFSVINASQGEIRKEILTVPVEEEKTPAVVNEQPGAKLKKLREELQNKILQQRTELWQKKQQQVREENETMRDGEDEKDGFENEILDIEEEEELTETEEEEEEEEDDVEIYEKPRKKSAFVDDEAEVSDENETEAQEESEAEQNETNKPRRRILNTFDDDSNSCDKNNDETGYLDTTVSCVFTKNQL